MTFTVSHIRPDKTAEIVSTDRHSPVTASIKAAMHLFSVAKAADPAPARVFGQALLTEYTRANAVAPAGEHPLGAELAHESGHIYRIDSSLYPPNVCPCCSGLVRPGDSLYAGDDGTYCDGCYPYARETPQCLPANSAHPNPWTTDTAGARFCIEVVIDQDGGTGHDMRYSRTDSFDGMWDETENALIAWPGLTGDQILSVTITEIAEASAS